MSARRRRDQDDGGAERDPFETSHTAPTVLANVVWGVLRLCVFAIFVAVIDLAFMDPTQGTVLFWQVIVPLLPMVFVVAPGLWRNVCPWGFVNQLPRTFGLSFGRSLPNAVKERAFLLASSAFVVLVVLRKPLLNDSGWALGLMLASAALLALIGGIVFKGKSGWCGTFCPLAPIQMSYGHAPLWLVHNSYCKPCVGCQKNCYDFNPRAKMFEDLSDPSEDYKGHRKLFVGMLPGLVWAYFNGPSPRDVGALWYTSWPLLSLAAFHVVHYVFGRPLFRWGVAVRVTRPAVT